LEEENRLRAVLELTEGAGAHSTPTSSTSSRRGGEGRDRVERNLHFFYDNSSTGFV